MARLERPTTESKNPATQFLSWKSNDKNFSYWSKQEEKNISVELPFKFLFLEHYHTVKGWHDATESGIYANEVYGIGNEPLKVRAFKGGELAEGLYKDIKSKVKDKGGVYHRSIYGMLEDGSIVNVSIKGSAVSSYSDFYKEHNNQLDNRWIIVDKAIDGKKGSIKFSKPNFVIGETISTEENDLANEAAKKLQEYMNDYTEKPKDAGRENSAVDAYENTEEEDLEF